MATTFDPYHKWLGIPPEDQPADYYRLLGLQLWENDQDVIQSAADQRMSFVRSFQSSSNARASQEILNEIAAARVCLLDPRKRAVYDQQLRSRQHMPAEPILIEERAATTAPPRTVPKPAPIAAQPVHQSAPTTPYQLLATPARSQSSNMTLTWIALGAVLFVIVSATAVGLAVALTGDNEQERSVAESDEADEKPAKPQHPHSPTVQEKHQPRIGADQQKNLRRPVGPSRSHADRGDRTDRASDAPQASQNIFETSPVGESSSPDDSPSPGEAASPIGKGVPDKDLLTPVAVDPADAEAKKPVEKVRPADVALPMLTIEERMRFRGHGRNIESLTFAPDGKSLASCSDEIRLWDTKTGRQLIEMTGHDRSIRQLAFFPDGTKLASASFDKSSRIWNVENGQELAALRHSRLAFCVALSPDAKTAAVTSGPEIHLWDVTTGMEKGNLRHGSGLPHFVTFSADGKTVVTWQAAKQILVWNAETGRLRFAPIEHVAQVCQFSFSPDGKTLAVSSFDPSIVLYDVATGREKMTIRGHTDRVRCVDYSPDGTVLVSGSDDGSIKLWSATSGREIVSIVEFDRVGAVEISPDGKLLAAVGNYYTIGIWELHGLR